MLTLHEKWVNDPERPVVVTPQSALNTVLPFLVSRRTGRPHSTERLVVAALAQNEVIKVAKLTQGSHRNTVVDTAHILRWVLTRSRPATAFILAHNHPSGDPNPSYADIDATSRVKKAAITVNLTLLDHIIVGSRGRYTSLRERGYLP